MTRTFRHRSRALIGLGTTACLIVAGAAATSSTAAADTARHHATFATVTSPVTVTSTAQASTPKTRRLTAGVPSPKGAPARSAQTLSLAKQGTWSEVDGGIAAIAVADAASATVQADVLGPDQASRLGLRGLVLRLSPVANGTSDRSHKIEVSVGIDELKQLYGKEFADNARWLALSNCGATSCRSSVVTSGTPSAPSALTASVELSSSPMLLTPMTAAAASNGSGDASATPLSAASLWSASPQTGDFTWNYPLTTPPAPAGPEPQLSIGYDSNSINGQTGSTNNQPSQVGEGFDLSAGGYIARSYASCSDEGITDSGDQCWSSDNAILNLGGHSGQLVVDSSGDWKLADDDGSRVEHLTGATGCVNGTYNNECWRVTTTDGTQYYFGRNQLPAWTSTNPTTNSTWTVPVCGTAVSACAGTATTASPFNTQGWRWNLDYVVDPHGNSEAFYYTIETNNYAEKSSTTNSVAYVRGGYLSRIDYGMQAGHELDGNAPDQVIFTSASRCETGVSGEPADACSSVPPSTANAQYWPDVPFNDFSCSASTCPGNNSPTFWSSQRLSGITTRYRTSSGSYTNVDSWTLAQSWPDPGDTTTGALTLNSITHAGNIGGSTTVPPVVFDYAMKPNRVAPPTGVVPLNKARLTGITTESGAHVTINYLDTDCSGSNPATPESNTKRCYPEYWTPPGATAPVLDWFRLYPVSSVIADPTTGGTLDHPDQTFYDYSLGTPAYRLDTSPLTHDGQRTWSIFAGYDKVRVEHGDPNDPATLQTTEYTYLRGLDGDQSDASGHVRTVTVTPTFLPTGVSAPRDALWWAGWNLETKTYNGLGGAVVSDTVKLPWASVATITGIGKTEKVGTSGTDFTYSPTARHLGQAITQTRSPLSDGTTRTTQSSNTYDALGRVAKAEDLADISTGDDDQCTVTTYADNTARWLLKYPSEINTYAGTCAALPSNPTAATISDVRSSYDGSPWGTAPTQGDVTQTSQAQSFTGTTANWSTAVTASATYDALGRILSATDALGRTTSTEYTPAAPSSGAAVTANVGPLTQTVTTDALGNATTSVLEPAWGAVTSSTDANNHVTTTTYDGLGRTIQVWNPDRPESTNPTSPSVSYSYTLSATSPTVVKSTTLTPTGGTMDSYQLYDGLLRLRQTQAPAESTSNYAATPGSAGSSVTEQLYDYAGQVTANYGPYWITQAPSATLWTPTAYSNIAAATTTAYDGTGRTLTSTVVSYGNPKWHTSYAYPGTDRIDVTPPSGATATTTYSDALGRTTALLQYHGDTIGDPTAPSSYDRTSYTYDAAGSMIGLVNAAGERWSWTYDTLGRQVSATDPDTGTTGSTYDAAGQLQSTTDATGSTLWYSYDQLGRKTQVNQTSATGPMLDKWVYDTLPGAKGLLTSSTSYVGSTSTTSGTPYTEEVTGYDASGRPLGTKTTLPAGSLYPTYPATSYTTTVTYNPDGTLATQVDPAEGGVTAERLHFTYTSLGHLYSIIGAQQYLTATAWDPATGVMIGQDRSSVTRYLDDAYTYDPGSLRLSNAQATTPNGQAANINYEYTDSGSVTSISNNPSAGAPADTQCFTYDYGQRLTAAWTPSSGNCSTGPASTALGGPAPYWSSYTYSVDGNRTSATRHATAAAGTDQRDTYAYPAATSAQPNAVTGVSHATAPAGTNAWTATGSTGYTYTSAGQTSTAGSESLTWTPQGELASVSSGSSTQKRVYDANGELLLVSDPVNGTTAYVGDTDLHTAAGSTTIIGQRIVSADGTAIAVRASTGLNWLDDDPQGTSELSEAVTTGAITRRYFDPFGNSRDGSPVAWAETNRGFLNAPNDPFTQYTHLGARDYDPTTGRFLSVDPLLDVDDPQSMSGYAYADNDPTNGTDRTGLCYEDSDGVWVGQGCTGHEPGSDGIPSNYIAPSHNGSSTITDTPPPPTPTKSGSKPTRSKKKKPTKPAKPRTPTDPVLSLILGIDLSKSGPNAKLIGESGWLSVDDVIANPSILEGMNPDDLLYALGGQPDGYGEPESAQGKSVGPGWKILGTRKGGRYGRSIRWSPGDLGKDHPDGPYWRVSANGKVSDTVDAGAWDSGPEKYTGKPPQGTQPRGGGNDGEPCACGSSRLTPGRIIDDFLGGGEEEPVLDGTI